MNKRGALKAHTWPNLRAIMRVYRNTTRSAQILSVSHVCFFHVAILKYRKIITQIVIFYGDLIACQNVLKRISETGPSGSTKVSQPTLWQGNLNQWKFKKKKIKKNLNKKLFFSNDRFWIFTIMSMHFQKTGTQTNLSIHIKYFACYLFFFSLYDKTYFLIQIWN